MDGPTALPIPHKNIPPFAERSCSFRARICRKVCPASVPKRVQQKQSGIVMALPLSGGQIMQYYAVAMQEEQDEASQLLDFMNREGLSQTELARLAKVHQSTVSR